MTIHYRMMKPLGATRPSTTMKGSADEQQQRWSHEATAPSHVAVDARCGCLAGLGATRFEGCAQRTDTTARGCKVGRWS